MSLTNLARGVTLTNPLHPQVTTLCFGFQLREQADTDVDNGDDAGWSTTGIIIHDLMVKCARVYGVIDRVDKLFPWNNKGNKTQK